LVRAIFMSRRMSRFQFKEWIEWFSACPLIPTLSQREGKKGV
jgi:hypothetical protein